MTHVIADIADASRLIAVFTLTILGLAAVIVSIALGIQRTRRGG